MATRVCNDDENKISYDEKDLPLPLPFPLPDEDEIDADPSDSETSNDERRKEALLDRISKEKSNIDDRGNSDAESSVNTRRKLDRLPSDVFVLLCCSLTVRDIASLAVCSKALYVASLNQDLWREKFKARWNYDDPTIIDWSSAYRQAYSNPHDLWITHWNCVEPCDNLGPGRCCIRKDSEKKKKKLDMTIASKAKDKNGTSISRKDCKRHRCPSCRYHPSLENNDESVMNFCGAESNDGGKTPISTAAQAIHVVTSLRLEESSHLLPCKSYSPEVAEHAFKKATTFHRSIDYRQYKADSLFFLNDLLFFHVHDDHDENSTDDQPFEMRDWKTYTEKMTAKRNNNESVQGRDLSDFGTSEPALHSWHLANVCNPDYDRPMVWRIMIQRSDCFTVFPSEGYLLPGESKVVTFGVKPFGSLLAHATNQLNIHRDTVDDFWGNLYKQEAHLPYTPFLLQYQYASTVPCSLGNNTYLMGIRQQQEEDINPPERPNLPSQQSQFLQRSRALSRDSPWRQCSLDQNQDVRSVSLAGHVHANYGLSEFRRKTLVPYTLASHQMSRTEKFIRRYIPREQHSTYSMSPIVFCSPQLMEFHPSKWRRLQALRLEEPRNKSILAAKYRTESACHECGLAWGPRMEELGQAFVLAKLEMESTFQRKRRRIHNLHRILLCLVQQQRNFQRNPDTMKTKLSMMRNKQIIGLLRKQIMTYRGAPWLNATESRVFLQWEILLDNLYRRTRMSQDENEVMNEKSLRYSGVYRYPTCTDSVFNKDSSFDRKASGLLHHSDMIVWKDEPKHLREFSHLSYGPGKFCFPPEGRNEDTVRSTTTVGVDDIMTDTFMNDHLCGLKAAISVLADPRSLLINGLFDEVPYPGSISRRPKLPILLELHEGECRKKIRNQYQACFDPFITSKEQLAFYEMQESLDIQGLLIVNSFYNQAAMHSFSLRNFIQNTPAPGSGRFAINRNEGDVYQKQNFWFLDDKNHGKLTECIFEETLHTLRLSKSSEQDVVIQSPSQQTFTPRNAFGEPHIPAANNHLLDRGPRILNNLWLFSSQLGWTVGSYHNTDSVYVDRRIIIGAQCLSLTLTVLPILTSLFTRYFQLIPAIPTLYHLDGLPYETENKMRFLTEAECGYAGLSLLLLHCILCRWIERYTNRSFFRAMVEHVSIQAECGMARRFQLRFVEWIERVWDATCPMIFQRLIFLPRWNRRSQTEFLEHLSYWRSQEYNGRQGTIRAIVGRDRIFAERRDKSIFLKDGSRIKKALAGVIMVLGGFSTSSPYFFLNVLAVASCSMSLGISMSLQSLETGWLTWAKRPAGSVIESFSLVTCVIFGLLVGQLIGGSGGVLFLVEFAVTAISLVLGGMGTISASGMKSWGTFFCLSLISFWGYLFGRCAVIESIKKKKSRISSVILCTSFFLVISLLSLSIAGFRWETVVDLVIKKPILIFETEHNVHRYKSKQLA